MPIHRICDTNVFRNIGASNLNAADLKGEDVTLYYSPSTVLELASRYTEDSFEQRRAAAQAIIDTGAELLPDPETYLTRDVFGFDLNEAEFNWSEAVHAMAQSQSMQELQQGVVDYQAGVRRQINLTLARHYRDGIDRDFVEDMLTIQKRDIPGFGAWWNPDPLQREGRVPRLTAKARAHFLAQTQSHQHTADIIQGCQDRALFKTDERPPSPPTPKWAQTLADACARLEFYVGVYTQYLIRLLTAGMLPRVNDWWDLEITIYSQDDDHVIVTFERKWKSIATDAGFPQRVIRVQYSS